MVRDLEHVDLQRLPHPDETIDRRVQHVSVRIAGEQTAATGPPAQHGDAAAVRLRVIALRRGRGERRNVETTHPFEAAGGLERRVSNGLVRVEAALTDHGCPLLAQRVELIVARREHGHLDATR